MRRLIVLACGVLLGLLALAAPAQALFGQPVTISEDGTASSQPQIATDLKNNAISVWTASDGETLRVQAAFRPAGGSFGTPQTLSAEGRDAYEPQVAFDDSGNAIAVWTAGDGANLRVQSAFRPRGGAFGDPQTLSPAGADAYEPEIAIDGNAVATWTRSDGSNLRVQAAFRSSSDNAFGNPRTLSDAGQDGFEPDVSMDPRGNATVVWTRNDGTSFRIQSSYKPRTERFGAAVTVSGAGEDASQPRVASDKQGGALAVWTGSDGSNTIVQGSYRPKGGAFAAPGDLSGPGHDAFEPQVAFDESNNALAAWTRSDGDNLRVQSAFRPKAGSFGAADTLSGEGQDAFEPQVGIDESAVVVWTRSNGENLQVQSAFRPKGGSFGNARNLSGGGENAFAPQVAVDESGNGLAVWTADGSGERVEFAFRPRKGSYGEPGAISAPGRPASQPEVATDLENNAIAVWSQFDGSELRVQAAYRPAGGVFGPAETLSDPGEDGFSPEVAFESDGDAVAVWTRSDGDNLRIEAAVRPSGGAFGAAEPVSEAGHDAFEPQVAGSEGAVAVWTGSDDDNLLVQAAFKGDAGGFGPAATLSAAGKDAFEPQVAVSDGGAPTAVWTTDGDTPAIEAAKAPSGGPFGPPADISLGEAGSEPKVAISHSRIAMAVWTGYDGANLRVRAARRSGRGAFGAPVDVSAAGSDAAEAQIAFSEQEENALVVWTKFTPPTSRIQASIRPPGGSFSAPENVSPAGLGAYEPQVAMDDSAAVVWTADDGEALWIQSAFRPATGPFEPAETLSDGSGDAFEPQVAVDERGNALAVWTGFDGAVDRIWAAFRPR